MKKKDELDAHLTTWMIKFLLRFLFMNCSLLMVFWLLLLKTNIFVGLFSVEKVAE